MLRRARGLLPSGRPFPRSGASGSAVSADRLSATTRQPRAFERAALRFGRPTRPACTPRRTVLPRAGRRRVIGVELARIGWRQAFVREHEHLEHDRAAWSTSAHLVARTHPGARARRSPVEHHVARVAGFLSERARLVEPRRAQPAIDANRVHRSMIANFRERRGLGQGGSAPARLGVHPAQQLQPSARTRRARPWPHLSS